MNLTLRVWRQKNARTPGRFVEYQARNVIPDMSFLEMLDVVNQDLIQHGEDPIAFDSDCREGICGTCSLVINGIPHGGHHGTTVCQLHMRFFRDGQSITIEPWRGRPFPVVKDLIVDRSAFDHIVQAGGFVSVSTGQACEANAIAVPKHKADLAMSEA
jgi:succinate dehydrogenase / fumarate reductase, iron-sulfur subunit